MKFIFASLLLGASISYAQVPAPQVLVSGTIGGAGNFPTLNSGSFPIPSDSDYTVLYPNVSCIVCNVTSSVTLTATRNLIEPTAKMTFNITNATTGGQSIVVKASTGSGVTIANGTSKWVWFNGTNYVEIDPPGGGGGGSGTVTTLGVGNLSPLFSSSVANPTTTPAVSFTLTPQTNSTFFGNFSGSTNAPGMYTLAAGSNVTITPSGSTVTISSSGTGSGCAPSGSTNDLLINNGTGGCSGNNGVFSYNPVTQLFGENFTYTTPGYNFGNYTSPSTGSTLPTMWQTSTPSVYGQGNFSMWAVAGLRKFSNGDANLVNLNYEFDGADPDFSAEGVVGIRNQHFMASGPLSGTVSTFGTVTGGNSLSFSATNGSVNWGAGRPTINEGTGADVQAITIASTTISGSGGNVYAIATVSGTPFTVSTHGTLVNQVNVTPNTNNTPTSVTLTLSAASGCSTGQLLTLGGPLIESGKITATGTSGSNQTATLNLRITHQAGTEYWCGGWAGRFAQFPSLESGVKEMFYVLGTPANNQISIARQISGQTDGAFVQAGAWNIYHGGILIDPRDLSAGVSGNSLSVVSDSDATWATGSTAEVTDGLYQSYAGYKDTSAGNNNPYSFGQTWAMSCPPNSADCGDLNAQQAGQSVFGFINGNSASAYAEGTCTGIACWHVKPVMSLTGTWGTLFKYWNVPLANAPIMEFIATPTSQPFNLLQIDDDIAYWAWQKSSHLFTFAANNFLFGEGNGATGATGFVINGSLKMPLLGVTGTCAHLIAEDSSGNFFGTGCTGGSGSNVQVNGGSTLSTANFGASPAAGANGINVTWQASGTNVSAEIVGDGNAAHFLNGAGGFTAPSGGGGISGLTAGYIPLAGSATTLTGNSHIDDGVTTAATITITEPITITGGPGLVFPAGTAAAGGAGKVVYSVDATSGFAEVNENNTGLSRVCTAANGICSGGVADTTTTVGTTAVSANSCSTATTVTMTGLATSMTAQFTPTTDVSAVTGWGPATPGLYISAWPSATNTLSYKVCNSSGSSITPGSSVVFNVSAR